MRLVVAALAQPFQREDLLPSADEVAQALRVRGYDAEAVTLPFSTSESYVPEQVLALRLFDLQAQSKERFDRLITLGYPAFALPHPHKIAWFAQRLEPTDLELKNYLLRSDTHALRECRQVFPASYQLADALRKEQAFISTGVLYAPLAEEEPLPPGPIGETIVCLCRSETPLERLLWLLEGLAEMRAQPRLVLASLEEIDAAALLTKRVEELGLADRVSLRPQLSYADWVNLVGGCCAVVLLDPQARALSRAFLAALRLGRPTVLCVDAGAPLELIAHEQNGLLSAPAGPDCCAALERLWLDRTLCYRLGQLARTTLVECDITWDRVVQRLVA